MQIQHIYALVQAILHPKHNDSHRQAESILMEMYNQHPQDIIITYIDILQIQTHHHNTHHTTGLSFANFRKFIALQLNNCLSKHPRPPYQFLWPKLTQSAQQTAKQRLCGILVDNQYYGQMKQLCEVVGNLASHIIDIDDHSWPQLGQMIVSLVSSQEVTKFYCGLSILQNFYQNQLTNYKEIIPNLPFMLQLGFNIANIDINYITLRCMAAYLLVLDHHRHKQFSHLIPMMYKTVLDMLSVDNTRGLGVLVQCLQYQPKFFKQQFPCLLQLCQHINNTNYRYKIKQIITAALLQYSYLCPSLFRTNPGAVDLLVDMIVLRMMMLPQSITNEWMVPSEGFNSQLNDQPQRQIIHDNLALLNRLIRVVGENQVLPRVKYNIDKLLSTHKWTSNYVAVSMLSQLGQFITDIDDIKPYIDLIFGLFKHDNPKLRYIAVHAIGMIAQQRKKQMKSRYAQLFIGKICQSLLVQRYPRVVSHIWNAMSNILTDFPYDYFKPYEQQVTATMLDTLNNDRSINKQSALFALSQIIAVSYQQNKKINKYLPTFIQIISQYFYSGEYLKPCYNNLRGYALQTLSSIALTIGREGFRAYLQPMTSTLLQLQNQQYSELLPPYGYMINAWTRLSYTFGPQLAQYVHKAMPGIFSFILSSVTAHAQQSIIQQPDQEQHYIKQQSRIDMTKQVQFGVKMISSLLSNMPAFGQCYYEEISAVYVALLQYSYDEDIKREVYESLAGFVDKLEDDMKKVDTATHLIQLIVTSMISKQEQILMESKMKAIACIMNQFTIKLLQPSLLSKLTSVMHTNILRSYSQIMEIMRTSIDFDRDELQQAEGQIVVQQSKLQAMSDVFTEILQLYRTEVVQFATKIMKQFVLELFQQGQRQNIIKVGVYLIDDTVHYIGYDHLQQYWSRIHSILDKYIVHNQCAIRQAASYGLGIFIQKCPKQIRNQTNVTLWLQLLHHAFLIPRKSTESKTKYCNCTDNIIGAMGKLISEYIDVGLPQQSIQFWLNNLPLNYDKQQNYEMINLVIELIQKATHIMCGYSKERTLQLLRIIAREKGEKGELGRLERMRLKDAMERMRLKDAMEMIVNSVMFVENAAELMGRLDQTTRATLQQLYNVQSLHH